jgi:hypothetical protein
MKNARILFTIIAVASLLCSLCTNATFDNPIDPKNPNHAADSLMEDKDNNGQADYYDHLTPVVTDKVPPIITFIGGDTLIIAQNDPTGVLAKDTVYARDDVDGNISGSVTASGTPFTSQCNTYTIAYSVSDKAGNKAQKTRVIIVDCNGPVITLRGKNPDSIVVGKKYTDPGATALDNIDGVVSVTPPPAANTATERVDTLVYSATDKVGNTSFAKRVLVVFVPAVIDSVPPVITLIGNKDTTIKTGTAWTEPGYTASDNIDLNITGSVVVSGTVNTALTGSYTISYNVSDKAGNAAATQTRKVTVVKSTGGPDVTPPVITLKGKNPDTVKVGPGTYTDPGCTATDDVNGDITAGVVVTELYNKPLPINTGSAGTYVLVYTVSDTANNKASATRYVYIVGVSTDLIPPVINLIGAAACSVTVGKTYTDPGATATDDVDGIITNKIKDTLTTAAGVGALMTTFTNTAGSYKLTYTVSDAAGNQATPKIRTILVQDTTGFGSNLLIKYGVPLTTPLPTVTTTSTSSGNAVTYSTITTAGTGAPNMSTVKSFTLKWRNEPTSQGLDNFSFTYTNGSYFSLKDNNIMTNTFSQANPGLTFANSGQGSGISGLDGSYYIKADATQCVWVKKDGGFAIIFTP